MTLAETQHHVHSDDGTLIGYRKSGKGPGLVICHGGGRISQNYQRLSAALANHFTVYIPDRRGRGMSGAAGSDYNMTKAVADLHAVLKATGAEFIFGHSAGGLIALETALVCPVKKLALYEPPVSVNHSLPSDWLPTFETALKKNQPKRAMAISLKGLKVQEEINKMPSWCLLLLINLLSWVERKKEKGTRMLELLHTLPADMKMAMELDSKSNRYNKVMVPTLLMAGSKSPGYFHTGITALENALTHSTSKLFSGFDHYSPEEKVQEIGEELRNFFL